MFTRRKRAIRKQQLQKNVGKAVQLHAAVIAFKQCCMQPQLAAVVTVVTVVACVVFSNAIKPFIVVVIDFVFSFDFFTMIYYCSRLLLLLLLLRFLVKHSLCAAVNFDRNAFAYINCSLLFCC